MRGYIDPVSDQIIRNYNEMQSRIDDQVRIMFDRTRDYNNAVVTIGYASFFGIWAFTKDNIPKAASDHVALAMGISIILFVLFVIVEMLYMTKVSVGFYKAMKTDHNIKSLDEVIHHSESMKNRAMQFEKSVKRASIGLIAVWPFFFVPSLLSGLYAAGILMYNFVSQLSGFLPYWPT